MVDLIVYSSDLYTNNSRMGAEWTYCGTIRQFGAMFAPQWLIWHDDATATAMPDEYIPTLQEYVADALDHGLDAYDGTKAHVGHLTDQECLQTLAEAINAQHGMVTCGLCVQQLAADRVQIADEQWRVVVTLDVAYYSLWQAYLAYTWEGVYRALPDKSVED